MGIAVITGGTDGIGRGLAEAYLDRGHEVTVVGRDPAKAASLTATHGRAHFIAADLSRIGENHRVSRLIADRYEAVDRLVLAARFHRSTRVVTPDGFESTFALFYLSRYLLTHGLAAALRRAPGSVVLNFGGAGQTGEVRWDDLQLEHQYDGVRAMGHAARLNDLLGVDFVHSDEGGRVRYILNHPGVVETSFAGEYDPTTRQQVDQLKLVGKSVRASVDQILPTLESGRERLTAVLEGSTVPLRPESWRVEDARRLRHRTEHLLGSPAQATDRSPA